MVCGVPSQPTLEITHNLDGQEVGLAAYPQVGDGWKLCRNCPTGVVCTGKTSADRPAVMSGQYLKRAGSARCSEPMHFGRLGSTRLLKIESAGSDWIRYINGWLKLGSQYHWQVKRELATPCRDEPARFQYRKCCTARLVTWYHDGAIDHGLKTGGNATEPKISVSQRGAHLAGILL